MYKFGQIFLAIVKYHSKVHYKYKECSMQSRFNLFIL